MYGSPASRPKRSSAFVSFYIDEDDFEDDSVKNISRSSKIDKEDIFIGEKYESNDSDSSDSKIEDNNIESAPKVKSKSIKKQNPPKVVAPKNSKSTAIKNSAIGFQNNKSTIEDDFELVVDEEDDATSRKYKSSKTEIDENENFEGGDNLAKLKFKNGVKKAKLIPQTKSSSSLKQKSEILSNRPTLPSSIEKVKIPGQCSGPRRVGLSKSAPTRPLSPVRLKKID